MSAEEAHVESIVPIPRSSAHASDVLTWAGGQLVFSGLTFLKNRKRIKRVRMVPARVTQNRAMACVPLAAAPQAPFAVRGSLRQACQKARVPGASPLRRGGTLRRVPAANAKAAESDDDFDLLTEEDLEFVGGEFVLEAFDDPVSLANALCLETIENAKACIEERGAFTFAVPGGSVGKSLAGLADAKGVDWTKVHVFFVNERVPGTKCYDLAMDTWATGCGIPADNVHKVKGDTTKKAAEEYTVQMRNLDKNQLPVDDANGLPVFDLILLGMGADGHVGSIYPDSKALDDESGAPVLAVDSAAKKSITFSLALINTADRVVVAASGEGKAETVRLALEDEDCKLPGALCDAFSQIWFLDKQAASKLQAYEETGEDEE